jgi:hypothetical protein
MDERSSIMARKMADCRQFPSEKGCTLTIVGEEDEVLEEAVQHAIRVHGHKDSAELRRAIRATLSNEPSTHEAPAMNAGCTF